MFFGGLIVFNPKISLIRIVGINGDYLKTGNRQLHLLLLNRNQPRDPTL
jgi:hypothetical protein